MCGCFLLKCNLADMAVVWSNGIALWEKLMWQCLWVCSGGILYECGCLADMGVVWSNGIILCQNFVWAFLCVCFGGILDECGCFLVKPNLADFMWAGL